MDPLFKKINGNIFKLNENVDYKWYSVTKQEEHQALEFIKKKVIPLTINHWFVGVDKKKWINHATKNIYKIKQEHQGESNKSKFSDYIEYYTEIVDVPTVFFIVKYQHGGGSNNPNGQLMVGLYGPLNPPSHRYQRKYTWFVDYSNKPLKLPTY